MLLVSLLIMVLITLSAMAKADENISDSITGRLIAPDITSTTLPEEAIPQIEESSPPANISSVEEPTQYEANETASEEFLNETETKTTSVPEIAYETGETTSTVEESTVDQTTSTSIVEEQVGQPQIESSLSSAKVVRGSNFAVHVMLRNIGNATANITGISFDLPEGISIYSLDTSICKYIEPGYECSFPAEFSTNYYAKTGIDKIRVLVRYG